MRVWVVKDLTKLATSPTEPADGDVLALVVVVAARSDAECYELALARMKLLAGAGQTEATRMLLAVIGAH